MRCWRFTTAAYVSHVTKADFFLCSHCSTPVRFFYITGSAFLKLRSRRSYLEKKNRLDKNKKKTAEPLIKTAQTQNYRKKNSHLVLFIILLKLEVFYFGGWNPNVWLFRQMKAILSRIFMQHCLFCCTVWLCGWSPSVDHWNETCLAVLWSGTFFLWEWMG